MIKEHYNERAQRPDGDGGGRRRGGRDGGPLQRRVSAELSIAPSWEYPGYYDVYVHGHVHTSAPNCAVGMRLKGDDPVFNDDLSVSASGSPTTASSPCTGAYGTRI